jgi:hypothetical protein
MPGSSNARSASVASAALWLCALALAAPTGGSLVTSRVVGHAVRPPSAVARARPSSAHVTMAAAEASASPTRSGKATSVKAAKMKPSPIWELDLYTRPVTNDQGKKLWELLVTDANGVMRHVEPLPSSLINSRELRKRIQALVDRAEVRPTQVRRRPRRSPRT